MNIKGKAMVLITTEQLEQLKKNGYDCMKPVLKLFNPTGAGTWLVTGIEDGILYGFADLGMGCVEWGGLFSIEEMVATRFRFGLGIERDRHWTPDDSVNYAALDSLQGV
jgi:hypothetical protein